MNYVRKHALQQAEEMGITYGKRLPRFLSNASGSYSSNVNLAVENSTWESESELAGYVPQP
jgi:magnesium chelatase subunit H